MKRLVAVLCALVLSAGIGMHFILDSPSEEAVAKAFEDAPFYTYPQPEEVVNLDVLETVINTRIEDGDNPRLLMGSSELSLVEPCSSHPTHFFGEHNYGFDTVSVGKAGYQSLWQAMELGALSNLDAVPGNKAALIVGMQWFMGDGCSPEAFLNSFSPDAYRECMANPRLSQQTKDEITARSTALGKSASDLNSLSSDSISDSIDRVLADTLQGGELRKNALAAAEDNTAIPEGRFGPESEPDWDAWLAQEQKEGEGACTTNDVGVYDEYYKEYFIPWLEDAEKSPATEPFTAWSEKELGDFELFLRVCNETGVEPLIIIMPVKAAYYDNIAFNYESRQLYYDMIRSTCEAYGVEYADYSGYEYDTYFMRDVMHFGWTGWVHVNRDLYGFFRDDEQ